MNLSSWNKETRQAYAGTLLYSLFGILAAILSPFVHVGRAARRAASAISAYAGVMTSYSGAGKGVGVFYSIVESCIIFGYIIFFLAIKDLKKISDGKEKKAFNFMMISILLDVLCAFFCMFHLRILGGLFGIGSCVLLVIAYALLKNSKSIAEFSPSAISGFKLLFVAEILVFASIQIAWIPFVRILGAIINGVAWILIIIGWKKVSTAVIVPGEEPVENKPIFASVKEVFTDSFSEAKTVAKEAAAVSKIVVDELGSKVKEASVNIKERLDETKEENASSPEEASPESPAPAEPAEPTEPENQ